MSAKSILRMSSQLGPFPGEKLGCIVAPRGKFVKFPLVLGLDSSTQSLSAVVVDRQSAQIKATTAVSYASDPRLKGFGLDPDLMLLPPRHAGEADQPPLLFLASLEALFSDLKKAG